MQTEKQPTSAEYIRAIVNLVSKMSRERAAEVYDFALFLSDRPLPMTLPGTEGEDWLNDSEEQMQAEDAHWETMYARHRGKPNVLADAARADIEAGDTAPLFDDEGEVFV